MRKRIFQIIVSCPLALFIETTAHAKMNSAQCSKSPQSIQDKALQHYKKKEFKVASDLVEEYLTTCKDREGVDSLLSDYSLYLYKSGQYDKCLSEFQVSMYPPNQNEDTKIADAIAHNFQLCLKARKEALGEPVPTTKCSLKSKSIPTGAIEFPGKESCVGFAEVRDECRQLALFEKDAKTGKIKKINLVDPIDDSILNDSTTCCWIEKIQLVKKNEQKYLYFNGGGRACGGGTMDAEIMSVYSIDGTTLKLQESVNVNYH